MARRGWIKTVAPEWVSTVGAHRPLVCNLWQTSYNAWIRVEPGDLILLKRRGSIEDIIGFGTVYCRFPDFTSTVWDRYGPGNGAADEGEFLERVTRQRRQTWVADPVIGNILIHDLVLFTDRPFKLLRQFPKLDGFHQWSLISGLIGEQITEAIATHSMQAKFDDAHGSTAYAHQGEARVNAWEDGVRSAYRQCCAVTKIRAREILRVVAIWPFELGGPLQVFNGLLLELDLATLLREKLIAFHLNGALLVSPNLALNDRELYRELAGKPLKLPTRLDEQPSPAMLQWRLKEHFLR